MNEVYCSECGKKNKSDYVYCKSCNSTLTTEKIVFGNKIESFDELVTQENYQKLIDTYFTPKAYNGILEEIIRIGFDKFEYDEDKTTLENIHNIVEQYVHIYNKHKGSALGYYVTNEIFIDERLPDAEQIATLIHELTHHIFAEIFEQTLMYALNVEKNVYIEGFVNFVISTPLMRFFNEYVAHSTEGQFIMHGCQNYGSFIQLMEEYKIDPKEHKELISLGRSISNDITELLGYFIDDNLRKNIIKQYTVDNIARRYDQIQFEEVEEMNENEKTELICSFLRNGMKACLEDDKIKKDLNSYKEGFK